MATLSNQLLLFSILGYLAAMILYAAEYTFGPRGAVARVARRPVDRELVGAAAVTGAAPGGWTALAVAPPDDGTDVVRPAGPGVFPGRPGGRLDLAGVLAVGLTLVAALTHLGALLTRAWAADRVPWGNMYEFVLSTALVAAVAWLVLVLRRPSARPLGLFVTLVLVILLGLAATVLYTPVAPLVPALNSYWLKIHVALAAVASGTFLVGFCVAALYLIRAAYDRGSRRFPATLGRRLPAAGSLERLTFRLHVFAFPLWTLAVICGAIWAEAAWGRYWAWDPKETWSFISWVVYAGYLHARATPSVRRTTTARIAVLGWATMIINLVGVNVFLTGLHSYAGL